MAFQPGPTPPRGRRGALSGTRAPTGCELHFRGLRGTPASSRMRRPRRQQPGSGRGGRLALLPRCCRRAGWVLVCRVDPKALFWERSVPAPCDLSEFRAPVLCLCGFTRAVLLKTSQEAYLCWKDGNYPEIKTGHSNDGCIKWEVPWCSVFPNVFERCFSYG